jgi:glycosyltransferase involved in cell wall biosynthesis
MTRAKVLFVVDTIGWSFYNIAKNVAKCVQDEFEIDIVTLEGVKQLHGKKYDLLCSLWWAQSFQLRQMISAPPLLTGWWDGFSWVPGNPNFGMMPNAFAASDVIGVGNEDIMLRMTKYFGDQMPPTFVLEDGVDTEMFTPEPFPADFVVGWAGNSVTGGVKGLDLVVEAAKLAKVRLNVLDVSYRAARSHESMVEYYNSLSAYICASSNEGTPNPIFEASSCGRPCISTAVGLAPKLILHGKSGLIVERKAHLIGEAMTRLKNSNLKQMGKMARMMAEYHSWEAKSHHWRHAMRVALAARG